MPHSRDNSGITNGGSAQRRSSKLHGRFHPVTNMYQTVGRHNNSVINVEHLKPWHRPMLEVSVESTGKWSMFTEASSQNITWNKEVFQGTLNINFVGRDAATYWASWGSMRNWQPALHTKRDSSIFCVRTLRGLREVTNMEFGLDKNGFKNHGWISGT